jgi:hypothetical protein
VVLNRAHLRQNPFGHDEHYGRHYGKYDERSSAKARVTSIVEGRQRHRARGA